MINLSKKNSSINSAKNKLISIEANLTEAHAQANDEGKEKIESAMEAVVKASESLSEI